jgi:endonuclease III
MALELCRSNELPVLLIALGHCHMTQVKPRQLVSLLERSLRQKGIDCGHVQSRGPRDLSGHIRGLVLSLLSSQRPWGPIEARLNEIDKIFSGYDADTLKKSNPAQIVAALRKLQCGNRRIEKQMSALSPNIAVLENIIKDHGSLDNFVNSATPTEIARQLSTPGEKYKLGEVGFTLAVEYLRNVGINAAKPDLHVRRVLSSERLGFFQRGTPTAEGAYELMNKIAEDAGVNASYLDGLLWRFCAKNYANICSAVPNCSICCLSEFCNYPKV